MCFFVFVAAAGGGGGGFGVGGAGASASGAGAGGAGAGCCYYVSTLLLVGVIHKFSGIVAASLFLCSLCLFSCSTHWWTNYMEA